MTGFWSIAADIAAGLCTAVLVYLVVGRLRRARSRRPRRLAVTLPTRDPSDIHDLYRPPRRRP